ncbi:MAG TPA: aconitate hydratase AcnA [Chloroflexota bacterium]|jgi:aconitate hydratase|nr:aconitate hydratase AcnA [Chloroflexota bacterium]
MTSGPTSTGFGTTRATLETANGAVTYYPLTSLLDHGVERRALERLPVTIKVLLENLLRHAGNGVVRDAEIEAMARWSPVAAEEGEFPFYPARVLLQDFTGVPAAVDLAAMRSAMARLGGDPKKINPLVPADLVIDHSVQVDYFGSSDAFGLNVDREYERNIERYALLRWTQQAFENFRVVPPGRGIVHQINLEYLASVVFDNTDSGQRVVYPDSLVGTDSHTTMVNGLGVLGWGVGGIEAEAVLLGQPLYLLTPEVVGFRFKGRLPEGTTATDVVLTVTQMLRKRGVVGRFVEFTGIGLNELSLADRATISNMCPEYGATAAMFPVDEETLRYLRLTGRDPQLVDLVERYTKAQGLFRTDDAAEPEFSELLELDLATVVPSLAGPRRPQDRVTLSQVAESIRTAFPTQFATSANDGTPGGSIKFVDADAGTVRSLPLQADSTQVQIEIGGRKAHVQHGSVAIAAITSCTNTSNPLVMIGAGLVAKKAVEKGLSVSPAVKTSLAPGSRVVTDYLKRAGLLAYLEALQFHVVGYGCTTCIGNSGPLAEPVAQAIQDHSLVVAAVLSGNRNFEARIHPQVRASYLASPPLVVAFALAGTVDIDLTTDPIAQDPNGNPVYLKDLWPTQAEIRETMEQAVGPDQFHEEYAEVFDGDEHWQALPLPERGDLYEWDANSTYVQEPPYFQGLSRVPVPLTDIEDARVLVMLSDSITTDHISPAGSIPKDAPSGRYLLEHGVPLRDFNSYGARRGNHQVMLRGTFGNVRLRNELVPDREGDWTLKLPPDWVLNPQGEVQRIFDASMEYQSEGVPLVGIAGKEYGSGSSRDWAAKGTALLGMRAIIAESYERIHRSNLVGMGVLPLQFKAGETRQTLGLTGLETFGIAGITAGLHPGQTLNVHGRRADGSEFSFDVVCRIDTPVEIEYYRHGGILPYVLRLLLDEKTTAA